LCDIQILFFIDQVFLKSEYFKCTYFRLFQIMIGHNTIFQIPFLNLKMNLKFLSSERLYLN
jgi:hypothetical protein